MAEYNGTGSANTYGGTSEDDTIFGFGGNDDLGGAGGNDTIVGGDGADTLAGGAGNDYFGYEDSVNGFGEIDGDEVDGGSGDDTISVYIVNATTTVSANISSSSGGTISDGSAFTTGTVKNVEFFEVLNSGEILEPGKAGFLTLTNTIVGSTTGTASTIDPEYYDGNTITANAMNASGSAGLTLAGQQLNSGDTYSTSMGEIMVQHVSSSGGYWTFTFVLPEETFYAVGLSTELKVDEVISTTFTDTTNGTYTTDLTFGYYLDADVDASGASEAVSFTGDSQDSTHTLSGFNDTVSGGDGDDTIDAGDGDDRIWAGTGDTGADSLSGGTGSDVLAGAGGNDTVYGGSGNDTVYGGSENDSLFGEGNNDVIWSGSGADTTSGGDGNDTLGGGEGNDQVSGGAGSETIYAGDGNDSIEGDDDNDTIFGGGGNDSLYGNDGNDEIFNGTGDDLVFGGTGDDTLWGGPGNDELNGGTGNDIFAFTATTGADTITDFQLTGSGQYTGDALDLTEWTNTLSDEITYGDLIDAMTNSGSDVQLFLSPGNTITFSGLSVTDFQAATPDWAIGVLA